MYTEEQLTLLKNRIKARLSEKRFNHTLGVEKMAGKLGEKCLPECIQDLRACALLHDVAKELPVDVLTLMLDNIECITKDDMATPAAYHAFAATALIKKDFAEYSSDEIISAVFKHTTSDREMSVFDQIIYLSDYIEDGRDYPDCIKVRKFFFDNAKSSHDVEHCRAILRQACKMALENTVNSLMARHLSINQRTIKALECVENTWQK